ncbi:MAG: DUF6516 family protein [Burkholderiales bacterium]
MITRDGSLDALLLLDGDTFFADEDGEHWVKFAVKQVQATPERPHGLNYSLTQHNKDGTRLVGFDNAHPIREGSGPGTKTRVAHDHLHGGEKVRFYTYQDAATLLADFWTEVEAILQKRSN